MSTISSFSFFFLLSFLPKMWWREKKIGIFKYIPGNFGGILNLGRTIKLTRLLAYESNDSEGREKTGETAALINKIRNSKRNDFWKQRHKADYKILLQRQRFKKRMSADNVLLLWKNTCMHIYMHAHVCMLTHGPPKASCCNENSLTGLSSHKHIKRKGEERLHYK